MPEKTLRMVSGRLLGFPKAERKAEAEDYIKMVVPNLGSFTIVSALVFTSK
jgi:hypothetical protein